MRFVAGRGAVAERLVRGTGVAESLVRGTVVADRLVRGTALAELLLAREPPAQRTAGRDADEASARQGRRHRARAPTMRKRCCGARAPTIRRHRRGARALAQRKSAPAEQGRWQRARAGAGRQILSDSPSDFAITSAAQVLPYVFTAVRGISQSC